MNRENLVYNSKQYIHDLTLHTLHTYIVLSIKDRVQETIYDIPNDRKIKKSINFLRNNYYSTRTKKMSDSLL